VTYTLKFHARVGGYKTRISSSFSSSFSRQRLRRLSLPR
jgi:hypothetical protein